MADGDTDTEKEEFASEAGNKIVANKSTQDVDLEEVTESEDNQ